ncbi:hypothetical protein CAPN001_07650 [Capnocytophaga stomatis]|uniref:hypothetical protein n=1 Tax=Capnocytophaga stomatis TaxID=1848904 RepID=UPI00194E9D1A|nr:hypothetical protein [Capnocytophaga stomatis]GIJ96196.1 hypothetical protein CAPN001_07650 [Capnocytophaga stomatis]
MENKKDIFVKTSYDKLKTAIENIANEEDVKDVYALSFWFYCDDDDQRYPKITLGYNTLSNFKEEAYNADTKEEAKWNFAYWLQNEIETVGGENDELLSNWFTASPHFYTEEENERAMEEDEALYEKILKKGEKFQKEFINEVISIAKKLFEDKVIEKTFGNDIPIIIHELEYYDEPIRWTKKANPAKLIKEFIKYWDDEN